MGSEMCIRDSFCVAGAAVKKVGMRICGKASEKMGAGKILQGFLQCQQVWVKNSTAVRADNMLTHMFAKPYNRPISNAFQMEAGASAAFQR